MQHGEYMFALKEETVTYHTLSTYRSFKLTSTYLYLLKYNVKIKSMSLNVGMFEQNNEWFNFCKAVLFKPKLVELFWKTGYMFVFDRL